MLHEHRVVIPARQHVTINLEKVHSLTADAKGFAVLVEDCSVTEAIPKKNLHYCRCKGSSRQLGDRFHASKTTHATTADEVNFGSFETRVLPGTICVKMHN
jgi:hypothetical protein